MGEDITPFYKHLKKNFDEGPMGYATKVAKKIDQIYSQDTHLTLETARAEFIAKPSELIKNSNIDKRERSSIYEPMYTMLHCGYTYLAQIRYNLMDLHKNYVAMTIGATGSGKTYFDLFFCTMVDPTFTIERVVFTPKQYLNLVKVIKPGEFILWDEMGAGLGARDHATRLNKNVGAVFQTQRYKQFGAMLTAPNIKLIDKQPRELLHAIITMKKIIKSYQVSIARIYENKVDPLSGKVRTVLPKIRIGNVIYKIREFAVHKPTKKLCLEYEKVKNEFFEKNVLGKAIQEQVTGEDKIYDEFRKKENLDIAINNAVKKVLDEPEMFGKLKEGVWRFENKRIQLVLNITKEVADSVRYRAEYAFPNR